MIAFLVASGVINLPFRAGKVERQISQFAAEMNKRLPMQVDEFTRWDRVEPGPGKAYSYIYTLSMDLTEEEKREVVENVTRRALDTPEMQATFAAGVTVWYKYFDTSGKKLLEFSVKK